MAEFKPVGAESSTSSSCPGKSAMIADVLLFKFDLLLLNYKTIWFRYFFFKFDLLLLNFKTIMRLIGQGEKVSQKGLIWKLCVWTAITETKFGQIKNFNPKKVGVYY